MENLESHLRQKENVTCSQMLEILQYGITYRARILLIKQLLNKHDKEMEMCAGNAFNYVEDALPF